MRTNLYDLFAHPGARRGFLIHTAIVVATAVGTRAIGRSYDVVTASTGGPSRLAESGVLDAPSTTSFALPPLLVIATAIGGGIYLANLLGRLSAWDRRLATLSDTGVEPFALTDASGGSPADVGWNRLLEQGRRWQALSELERSVSERVADRHDGDTTGLLDALADGVVAVDAKGQIVRGNAMMAAICGVDSAAKLHGKSLAEALGVEGTSGFGSDSDSRDGTAEIDGAGPMARHVAEWSLPSDDGGGRTLLGIRRPIADNSHDAAEFVWTVRDVTQQRLAESMREQFLSAATHEFRTPLANIRAYAESLDMTLDIDADARKHFFNVIQSESLRLSQLVDDLLDISRMQAGALALESHETDLGRLVEEAASKVQGQIREKSQQLRCEFPPKYPKVCVDKCKLTAALVNLLGNAAKYTPEGGQVTFRVDANGGQIRFSITDTGIGIDEAELPHVFDRFFRSKDDRVREITGSGLGLALSQEVARLHGGEVTVESELNKGSTFHLTIPLEAVT